MSQSWVDFHLLWKIHCHTFSLSNCFTAGLCPQALPGLLAGLWSSSVPAGEVAVVGFKVVRGSRG